MDLQFLQISLRVDLCVQGAQFQGISLHCQRPGSSSLRLIAGLPLLALHLHRIQRVAPSPPAVPGEETCAQLFRGRDKTKDKKDSHGGFLLV